MAKLTEIIKTESGNDIEIYENNIFALADEYINNYLNNPNDKIEIKEEFENIIYYIRDRIPKPSHDIYLLDSIFDLFVQLCSKCHIIPTLEAFSWLVRMDNSTFSDWKSGQYRKSSPEYSQAVKRWFNICKGKLTFTLAQSRGTDANRIFLAKAVYGLAETAPVPVSEIDASRNASQIAGQLGMMGTAEPPQIAENTAAVIDV